MMTLLTFLAFAVAMLVFGWALWFVIELIRYIASGEYEVDERLRRLQK